MHPSAAKADNFGPEIGTAKALPSQYNDDCARIESLFHLSLRRKSKCDRPGGVPARYAAPPRNAIR
jgi:hypothetical protein